MNCIRAVLVILASAAGCAGSALGDSLPPQQQIFGVLDLKTKTFTAYPTPFAAPAPLSPAVSANTTTAPRVVRGTLVLKFSIKLSPAVPAGKIYAAVSAIIADASPPTTGSTYQDEADGFLFLTRSGTTAVGSITLPYVATINSTTYQVQVSATPIQAENANGSSVGPALDLAQTIAVPASGTTTTLTLAGDL